MKRIITIFLLLIFTVTAASAKDFYIFVNSPEEVDSMYAILNAVASIFHNQSYLDLLKLMFLFGGFVSFFSWVIGTFNHGEAHTGASNFTKFNIGAVALLTLVFSMQSTVIIKSEHFPKYYDSNNSATYTMGVAVDHVPEIVGYSIYFLNSFGRGLQKMYQTAMTPVGTYSLSDGGYASSLRDDFQLLSMKLGDTDQTLGKAVDTVISQCVFIPFSAKGIQGAKKIAELKHSKNIKQTLDNWYSSGVTVGGIKASDYEATYNGEIWKCGDLWDYIKNNLLVNYNQKAGKYLKNLDSRDLEMITGLDNVPKSNFDEIALQAGIVNSVIDNKTIGAGVKYASGKTQAEFVQQNLGAGYYMAKMLPIMQSLFRALIYALLPAIIAISLLPGGYNILKNYAKTAVWIELWGVVAAILNFFILKYTEHQIAGDITVYSSSKMLSETAAMAGMAGYLYLMVPGIAWGLMSGSFNMLEGLGRGVAAGFAKNITTGGMAEDAKKQEIKKSASHTAGKDLSYAEAIQFENIASGIREGTAIGVDMKQGKASISNLAEYSQSKGYKDLQKKEAFLKKIGKPGSVADVVDSEATVGAGGLMKGLGEFATSGIGGMYGSGRHSGRTNVAMSRIEKKHGTGVTSAAFQKSNEDILRTNKRISTLKKEVGNIDSYFETSTKQDVKTQEVPNFLRNDRNGDGQVSDSEINFEQSVNTIEAKKAVVNKFAQQQQELKNAAANRHSESKTVRDAQASGEALMSGSDSKTAAIVGAAATKTGVGSKVENANQRKDSRVLEQLKANGKNMEETALLDSKRMLGDLAQTKTQTSTTGGLIKDIVKKEESKIKDKLTEEANNNNNLTLNQKDEAVDRSLMNSMIKVGIADSNLTEKNLSRDVAKVQNENQTALKEALYKTFSPREAGAFNLYTHLTKLKKQAEKMGDSSTAEALNTQIEKIKSSVNIQSISKKAEAFFHSNKAKSIIRKGQQKLEQVYNAYESKGLIRRDKNGNIQVADTVKTINALNGEQKALYVEQVKRSLDGLKTSTIGLNGMQLERVNNVLGDHVTERATATKEWSKTARFNHDIQYYAVNHNYIKPADMAKVNTAAGAIKNMIGLYGFTKVLKK